VVVEKLASLGYEARPFDPEAAGFARDDAESRELLRALAVAGFAAANIMMFSVSVWAGAEGATRDFFHWISAAIAIPAVAYAGRPFFRSAWAALSQARLNMDVPISLAVITAVFMSLYQTANSQEHAYFDAAVSLLFFLLIGRYLDHRMRARARSAVTQLMALSAEGATVIGEDGKRRFLPISELKPGMLVHVAPGENIPVDGYVEKGASDVDMSVITGESNPERVAEGAKVYAGAVNLTGPLAIRLLAAGDDTFLAEMIRLMASAEKSRSAYVRLADRLAGYYAPTVHLLAAVTLGGWLYVTGFNWPVSLLHAIAVLIITCPCALGLAVPAVQVVAAGVLFRAGTMVKDGGALEKLAEVDTVIFDKTGTLTLGRPDDPRPGFWHHDHAGRAGLHVAVSHSGFPHRLHAGAGDGHPGAGGHCMDPLPVHGHALFSRLCADRGGRTHRAGGGPVYRRRLRESWPAFRLLALDRGPGPF